jgi:zinc D-Ala-D-Ala carboxypeptidase
VTVLVAGMGLLLTLTLGWFARDLATASALDARAQLAADSAALAAAAESAPYGSGHPHQVARDYARSNGATLVECRCDPGATAFQVAVEVDGALAQARAVIDPALFGPLVRTAGVRGLHPRMASAVRRLVGASDGAVYVVSGWRSPQEQRQLWEQALDRYGSAEQADDWVAPPGQSMHERGLAVDLGGDIVLAIELIDDFDLPLWRPMDHEPWHFELLGSRGRPGS